MTRLTYIVREILDGARVGLSWGLIGARHNTIGGRIVRLLAVWV